MTVLDEAEMLIQLSWIIGNSASLEELLQRTVSQGASIMKVPVMFCAVLDKRGENIEQCCYQSASKKISSCSESDKVLGILSPLITEAMRESKTVYRRAENIDEFERACKLLELDSTTEGTFVASPLIINQKVIGSIAVFQTKVEAFTLHRTRLLEISTNVIAAGIHKLHLEKELRKSLDSLETRVEERTKDLEDFVYTVSHDLKSPLHAARGFANMIHKQFTHAIRSDEDAFVLRRVEENIEQALQMIDKLLQLSRIGTRELKYERVDLNEIVNDYFVELKALKKGEVNVNLAIHDRLPVINADRGRMVQLFTNLFDNSVKYMGGDSVLIEISAERINGRVSLTVQDNGMGIDERDLPNIFNIFYRGKRPPGRTIPEGAGVGLSIVKKIVEQHNGRINIEKAPKGGTIVRLELPES
jgi:signal transduction histidine kinase